MIFLLCCIGSIALVNGQEEMPSRRIIDGNKAQPGQFPFVARLFYGTIPACSASIIHERWSLTAAHCIKYNKPNPKILIGSVDSKTDKNGVYYNVERIVKHEAYSYIPAQQNNGKEYVVNDIGLVRLNRPIAFSENVKTILIPTSKTNYANVISTVIGFGLYAKDTPNNQLLYANMRLISDKECRAYYPYVVDRHICAAIIGRNSPCSGDSGGPLIVNNVEIGITSTVADEHVCNPNAGPSLFTKVSSFKPWIRQHLAAYGELLPFDK